jgi:hypothetical protein
MSRPKPLLTPQLIKHFGDLESFIRQLRPLNGLYWGSLLGYVLYPGCLWFVLMLFSYTYRITLVHDYLAVKQHTHPELKPDLAPLVLRAKRGIYMGLVITIGMLVPVAVTSMNLIFLLPTLILLMVFCLYEQSLYRQLRASLPQI